MSYKYLQLEEYIKAQILASNFKKGERISSEAELAKQFDLSRQTVRSAIADLVNSGYLYTVQGKGTFVSAGKPGKKRTYLIGFVTGRFNSYNIFPKILSGINSYTINTGYNFLIGETQNSLEGEYKCLQNFLDKGIDALIVDPAKSGIPNPNIECYGEFVKREIPVIFYNSYPPNFDSSYVIADDCQGGYIAAKHLLDYGHRDICGIFKLDDVQGHARFNGFARAFREYGLPIPENNILWFSSEDYPTMWNPSDYNSALDNRIMDKLHTCTAMVAYNDYVTVRVIQLLQKCNIRFPEDFSIVSFDNTDLTSFSGVSITSIEHPSFAMGESLGALVIELLTNPSKIIKQILPVDIVAMESTRKSEK